MRPGEYSNADMRTGVKKRNNFVARRDVDLDATVKNDPKQKHYKPPHMRSELQGG
jgi:hypothetical protein